MVRKSRTLCIAFIGEEKCDAALHPSSTPKHVRELPYIDFLAFSKIRWRSIFVDIRAEIWMIGDNLHESGRECTVDEGIKLGGIC
jgi:hypothetical protein